MGRGVRKHPVFKLSSCRNVPILKSCKEIILFQNRPSQTAIELRPQSIESGKPAGKPGKLFIASVSTPSPVTRETTKITRNWNSCLLNHHRHHLTSPCFGSSHSTWEWGGGSSPMVSGGSLLVCKWPSVRTSLRAHEFWILCQSPLLFNRKVWWGAGENLVFVFPHTASRKLENCLQTFFPGTLLLGHESFHLRRARDII